MDVRFWFDPICPFCWMTSKWLRLVAGQRDLAVEWRFISLRLVNAGVDYAAQFPPEYEAGHTAGLRGLRVAARTRKEHGTEALDRLQEAFGRHVFEQEPVPDTAAAREAHGSDAFLGAVLTTADLPTSLAEAADDTAWDEVVQAETDEALALTGRDVGTPIIQVDPPEGLAFFGPVISRMPTAEQAGELWDHAVGLARFPGFAELKRSLREQPQLPSFGVSTDEVGVVEDWHGGSRRQHR
ncbi:DsbA family protein [Actinomycetospora straminea]|uniref:Rv2466c family mycothiol-dependent reductase n=1 Tax=Actinomycetospora straminea TaxID=663607 RepID=A0ABP9F7C1_9PSEU|nr:DsbA family protein [Actinomycetospora straminea]MDD7936209.1 DsbA family protein [Actinomycetospora straminea]